MAERGDDFGFASEAFELLAIFGETRVENFHGDAPAESFLNRLVDRRPFHRARVDPEDGTDRPRSCRVGRSSAFHLIR